MNTIDIHEIQRLLPHRYPFLLIDRVIEFTPGEHLVGIKNVSFNEPHFTGHFPQRVIMPGVLILEALAQATVDGDVVVSADIMCVNQEMPS